MDAVRQAGVDVLRLSPQPKNTLELLATFRARLDDSLDTAQAAAEIAALGETDSCNGFWHARPGLERIAAQASLNAR